MAVNTKILADSIIKKLSAELKKYDLPYFKSIYVCGSYCRGDWLNSSSDLDIHTICDDNKPDLRDKNFELLKSLVDEALCGRNLLGGAVALHDVKRRFCEFWLVLRVFMALPEKRLEFGKRQSTC